VESIPRCLILFEESLKSQVTKKTYRENLDRFLKWAQKDYDSLLALLQNDLQVLLEDYVIFQKRRMNPNSVPKYLSSIFRFLKVNRKKFDKEAIEALYPEEIEAGGERAITTKEIQTILQFTSSKRVKALIHLLSATGHRPEALSNLTLNDMSEMPNSCLAFVAYRGSRHKHFIFCHSEAKDAIDEYLEERKLQGEKLDSGSFLFAMHDLFKQGINPKPLSVQSIDSMIKIVMDKAKISRVKKGNRFDLAVCGGFRKRFDTIMTRNPDISFNVVQRLLDHKVGLESHYFKPTKEEMFEEYQKGIPGLVISESIRLKEENKKQEGKIQELESDKNRIAELELKMENIKELLKRVSESS